jgi:hypothetical protein
MSYRRADNSCDCARNHECYDQNARRRHCATYQDGSPFI